MVSSPLGRGHTPPTELVTHHLPCVGPETHGDDRRMAQTSGDKKSPHSRITGSPSRWESLHNHAGCEGCPVLVGLKGAPRRSTMSEHVVEHGPSRDTARTPRVPDAWR